MYIHIRVHAHTHTHKSLEKRKEEKTNPHLPYSCVWYKIKPVIYKIYKTVHKVSSMWMNTDTADKSDREFSNTSTVCRGRLQQSILNELPNTHISKQVYMVFTNMSNNRFGHQHRKWENWAIWNVPISLLYMQNIGTCQQRLFTVYADKKLECVCNLRILPPSTR